MTAGKKTYRETESQIKKVNGHENKEDNNTCKQGERELEIPTQITKHEDTAVKMDKLAPGK